MLFTSLLFYLFSFLILIFAFLVLTAKNTVHSVMFLILTFVNAAGLFILLGAEFLAMLLIVVYVGAIAVLFLFVVMMLNIDEIKAKVRKINVPLALIVSVVIFVEMFLIISSSQISQISPAARVDSEILNLFNKEDNITSTHLIGANLYTSFFYQFQLSGAILFVAMIGAIVLTLRENRRFIKKQSISAQVNRKREDAVEVVKVESGKGLDV